MTLELESYYQNLRTSQGRSASICAPGCSAMETAAIAAAAGRRQLPPQNLNGRGLVHEYNHYSSHGSGGNMHISNSTSSPSRPRKHGAHRSQSARVVGSRPKIKRREQELQEYQQHLDLASSDGALRDSQDSYNPFLNKVPSTGRLVTSTSLEMSQTSLHHQGTPPPLQQQPTNAAFLLSAELPRDSPHLMRRHSGGGYERRGSSVDQKSTPEKDKMCYGGPVSREFEFAIIPTIATPEASPHPTRRGNTNNSQPNQQQQNKPTGLPKSPTASRSGSQRRVNSVKSPKKIPERYLDVPDSNQQTSPDDEDEESYRLRSFSLTPKGIVNRGDSFRRRRSRSNSLIPTPTTPELQPHTTFTSDDGLLMPANVSRANSRNNSRRSSRSSPMPTPNQSPRPSLIPQPPSPTGPSTHYRVAMIGARGVGKSALISQFLTSESINAYDRQTETDVEGDNSIGVMLNGEESELTIFKMNNTKTELNRLSPPDGFLLVYSVVDRASFQRVETELRRLQEMDLLRTKAVVIVANKIDLARSRSISTQDGRCLAVANRVKFIEVSVGINHNVDELLVGMLHQVRLKIDLTGTQESWCKNRGILKASAKARQMLTWLLGKEDARFKNCENLHVL